MNFRIEQTYGTYGIIGLRSVNFSTCLLDLFLPRHFPIQEVTSLPAPQNAIADKLDKARKELLDLGLLHNPLVNLPHAEGSWSGNRGRKASRGLSYSGTGD